MSVTNIKTLPFINFKDLILHEDEHILLVNKPLMMASLSDKDAKNLNLLGKKYDPNLRLCHRLDKNTSGVLLMAKTDEAYRHISIQFEKRKIQKTYMTLAPGVHPFQSHVIELPLYISSNKKVTVNHKNGKPSKTIVHGEEIFRNFSLLRCEPVTGRMHQIRVHLAAVGCPIVGDHLYGGRDIVLSEFKRKYKPSGRREEQPINHGYLLHAASLAFEHPATGEGVSFSAPYPKNFEVALKVLRKYNSA